MKKMSLVFFALAVFLWAGPAITVIVDGVFNLDEWAGHYTGDDGVGSPGYVGPGYGGQAYDVEPVSISMPTPSILDFRPDLTW